MDVFLGRNFVSGPRTLKPKKTLKNLKNLKKPKNLKKFLKILGFFQPCSNSGGIGVGSLFSGNPQYL